MISDRTLVWVKRTGERVPTYTVGPMTEEEALRYTEWRRDSTFETVPAPSCRCCGALAAPNLRCAKHQDRNPCAAEGCRRTGPAVDGQLHDDWTLCGEHWRAFVPAGSPTRGALNRLSRIARKAGYQRTDRWPDELEDRWHRLWRGVIRRVRRGADGHIDKAAIEKLFGWDLAA